MTPNETARQKNYVNVQMWVNTPETNKDKLENHTKNPNYVCLQIWFNRTSNDNWQPSLKVSLGNERPDNHKTTVELREDAIAWLRSILALQVENCEELGGFKGLGASSEGPYTLVTKTVQGVSPPKFQNNTFSTRERLLQHLQSTLYNMPTTMPEMQGMLPQPQDEYEETNSVIVPQDVRTTTEPVEETVEETVAA